MKKGMKLVTFSQNGILKIGVLFQENKIIDLVSACNLYKTEEKDLAFEIPGDMIELLNTGEAGIEATRKIFEFIKKQYKSEPEKLDDIVNDIRQVKIKAPVLNPRKIICLGLNYSDHAEEGGLKPPEKPILFSKPPTAIIGHEEPVIYPKISDKVDYEVELAVVMGKKGREIPEEKAYDYVAGYSVFNDVSARDIQFGDGQWFRGKSFDTFAPMGPCLTLKEQISNPQNLKMQMKVNGEIRQDSSTKNMFFKIPYLISFISDVMTLEPGDIIATGTPSGVGIYAKPEPRLLKVGDVMEASLEKLGVLKNPIKDSNTENE
ncbi:MAG: fumarylacetoacetate hydrolase family protein [Candidatus Freyarchaeum deiterrae]